MFLNLGTTGIGSHPIDDPKQVICDIFESKITHPYIPQLKSDEMILQYHYKFPGLSIQKGTAILDINTHDFETKLRNFKQNLKFKSLLLQPRGIEIIPKYFPGLFIFPELLRQSAIQYQGIKCQITGPITEAASIKIHPGNTLLIQNLELFDIIVNLTSELGYWLSSFLLKLANYNNIPKSNVILFVDEPLFPLSVEKEISYENALDKLSPILQLIQCTKGIHICDNPITVIDTILRYPIDLFSYDANKYPNSLKNIKDDIIKEYIERGGGFAFGITPNTPESLFGVQNIPDIVKGDLNPVDFIPTPDDLIQILEKNILPIEYKGISLERLCAQSLISPACGFRNFNIPTPEEGEKIVKRLLEIQEQAATKLRKRYNLHFKKNYTKIK